MGGHKRQKGDRGGNGNFSTIDAETLKYFSEISDHIKSLDNTEEKQLLSGNVLEETLNREVEVASDATCSRVLEALIPYAPVSSLATFASNCAVEDNLGKLCTGSPFGSHVIEKALIALGNASQRSNQEEYDEIKTALTTVTESAAHSLFDMISSKFGSFVARRLLCVLSGIDVSISPNKTTQAAGSPSEGDAAIANPASKKNAGLAAKVNSAKGNQAQTEAVFPELVEKIVSVVLSEEWALELPQLRVDAFAGPFLQALLRACRHNEQLQGELVLQMIGTTASGLASMNPDSLQALLTNRQSSHLMEVVFEVAPDEIFQKLCTLSFKGHLVALAQHPNANFAVQSALTALRKPQQLKRMLDDLRPQINQLLRARRGGVIVALLLAAGRLESHEGECASAVMHAVNQGLGNSKAGPIETLLILDTTVNLSGGGGSGNARLSSIGCAALNAIFQYPAEACKPFAEALAALSPPTLVAIAKDPGGCRVIEAYLEGAGAAPKKRKHILQSLNGSWAAIAGTGAGARFVEKCFTMGDPAVKEDITVQLAGAERLPYAYYGPALMRHCQVDSYKSGGADWSKRVATAAAAKKEFADLFGDDDDGDGNKDNEDDAGQAEEVPEKKKQDKKSKRSEDDSGDKKKKNKKDKVG